jgi:hypothetical protein
MVRLSPDLIRKHNPALTALAITLVLVDERKLKFKATCTVTAPDAVGGGTSAQLVEISDTSGKVRTWPDVDTLMRALGKALPTLTSSSYNIDMSALVPSYPETYTPAQIAAKQHGSIVKALPAQNTRVTVAAAALATVAAFENGTASQRGVWQEAKDRLALATAQQAFLITERDRLQLLFPPPV